MLYVEIELNGTLCAKRCPVFKTADGFVDTAAIRHYFGELGYQVGTLRVL